jgi:uncharacterized protein (TIGR03435 family)
MGVRLLAAFVIASALAAQAPDQPTAFEVASIKPTPPPVPGQGTSMGMTGGPGTNDPTRYSCHNCSLAMLITRAYDIKGFQLIAPDWAIRTRFEVTAKVPEGATNEQWRLMLQSLLAERFKLVIHRDQKEMQLYEMLVAKGGAKLKKSAPDPRDDDASPPPAFGKGGRAELDKEGYPIIPKGCKSCMIVESDKARMVGEDATVGEIAGRFSNQLGKLVRDATGIEGKYDFDLTWGQTMAARTAPGGDANTPLGNTPQEMDFGQMMIAAIQSQLGLRLELKKGMVEIIVVDHAEKTPTEN